MKNEIVERLATLRAEMKRAGVDATIIPKTDPHQSEYLADHWQAVKWLSGFTGSAGTLVVTADKALFWTDSRYFIQATEQLDGTTIMLMKDGIEGTPSIKQFLGEALAEGDTVGIDGMVFSITATDDLRKSLKSLGINIVVDFAPLDTIWTDRAPLPQGRIFIHDIKYAGESAKSKIAKVLEDTRAQGAESVFICDLAEIAWTLNIRCDDVECNPVATAFLLLGPEKSVLYTDRAKIDHQVEAYLSECNVEVEDYDQVKASLMSLHGSYGKILLSTTQSAGAFLAILGEKAVLGTSPVAMLKACKNSVQVEGFRKAMEKDGVALVKAFMEIEGKVKAGDEVTELDVADILIKYRSQQPLYYEPSFETIAGYGPHGAIVHYSATPESNVEIKEGSLLLVDSGASYLDGTTDITRTISLGEPTEEQRRDFTLVMKGMIALATAVFPRGTRGDQLDVLARQYLWSNHLSYLHGTGHGVGHFLNVHEGPQTIRLNGGSMAPLMPGMVTSDEPGLYRTDKWGIRCENLILTVEDEANEFGDFLKFETLTLFPFDCSLLSLDMMSEEEIDWLNAYHREVYNRLSPNLDATERAWLQEKTKEIKK